MNKFEHHCQVINAKGRFSNGVLDPDEANALMNEYGQKGFELVSAIPFSDGNVGTAKIFLFYKKKIE